MKDNSKPVAALFDLDGVVLDTENQYTRFWNDIIGRRYFPEVENWGMTIKGQTLTQIYDGNFPGEENAAVRETITRELNEWERNMSYDYIAGVERFLGELRDAGVRCAVVTSSNDEKMRNVFRAHPEINDYFERILTADMFTRSKPFPDCYLLGAKVFDTVPENCVVFEDSFHGLQSGRSAGMKVVGLSTTNSAEAISPLSDVVVPDFSEFTLDSMMALLDS
ncbi:MAG: HAD family hydrolase [Bacteroidaceae bacterium]|nr:HAD family hydrolase [Bacteroidaceae bacterium]